MTPPLRTLLITLILGAYVFTTGCVTWLYSILESRIARIEAVHDDAFKRLEAIEQAVRGLRH